MAPKDSAPAKSGELVIERVFDAPRELVWRAWTEPERMMRWWGPKDFTCPHCEIDFRVGGRWFSSMQSPEFNDGRPIWAIGVYREIVPLERIVTTDCFADEHGNVVPASHYGMEGDFPLEMLVTVTFEEVEDGKTRMTLRHAGLPTGEHREGANEGWGSSLDKLAAYLAEAQA
ncbi:MAG: SRPBCC domain-containing protein [Dehalococcoidia bacterium]